LNQSFATFRMYLQRGVQLPRLRGPLADNPNAKVLHALLLGLLIWIAMYTAAFLPRFVVRQVAAVAVLAVLAFSYAGAMVFLRRGNLRAASLQYLSVALAEATLLIFLNGGIRSPILVLYTSVPISAAWLLGTRAVFVSSAACLLCSLGMALFEMSGVRIPQYFPGTPLGLWAHVLKAIVVAAVPVTVVLRTLHQSLGMSQQWIGELRKAQEELRRERDLVSRMMETSPVGIVAVNQAGKITFANSSAERIFGLSRQEITARNYDDRAWHTTSHGGEPFPEAEHPFRQVQASGGTLRDVRVAIERPDGRRVLLSVNAAPVLSADGRFDGMVAVMEDVSERVRVEGELRKYREHLEDLVRVRTDELTVARDQAMAANRAKTLFLANMSHELRTPLNAILGFSRLLAEGEGASGKQLPELRIIGRSGEHLLDLINAVLDMSKIEAGSIALENAPTDLRDLVIEVTNMMRSRADEKGLKLLVHQSSAFPGGVCIDRTKLRQILINLVGNAIKYTERGQVALHLDAERAPSLRLILEVADTGIGIAAEERERIFHPFFQAVRHAGGTGLGLAITQQYVSIMGGTIHVDSALGRGSRFRVVLPAADAEPSAVFPAGTERNRVVGLAPGQPERRVLVVEDQEENRLLLQRVLSEAGFRVRAAVDGADAVQAFQSWHPHFIWMDWRLPVLDGRRATEMIRSAPGGKQVKIAVVTASVFQEERAEILEAGVDDFVRKPFRNEEIFTCMARHLGVRYCYAEADPPAECLTNVVLTPAALQVLPRAVRRELADALISLNVARVTEAIRRASELNRDVGAALAHHANRLEFTSMLAMLKACEDAVPKEAV
jgi:PAS domain S-box-containing protein